ncbi:hypothetical protein HN865_04480 [Candidatus Woesearchaeota archaeon]|jgi:hypothetical protein|nr:hypothetical protein [Candidatus Woesearchaeota archaeon]
MEGRFIKLLFVFTLFIFLINNVSASDFYSCELNADLVNQDPHPAIAGEYVEVLFQLRGLGSCDSGAIVELVLEYPFFLDSGSSVKVMEANTYAGSGFNSNWNIPYKIRIDPDALEGTYEIELRYRERDNLGLGNYISKKFEIELEDGRTDFEVYVGDHVIKDKSLVFEILNIGNQDIEALTVEIPKQENIVVKGANRNIVGDLDSNEYTTTDFEAIPAGGDINLILHYTDSTNKRRTIEKLVYYDPTYFIDSMGNVTADKTGTYVAIIVIVAAAGFFIYKRKNKNNKKMKKRGSFRV